MKTVISADELAKNVTDAEALLDRLREYKGEIDAMEDNFKQIAFSGQTLLSVGTPKNDEVGCYTAYRIRHKLEQLESEKVDLLALWKNRQILYQQCLDLQLFYRDAEQAELWMKRQEAFLVNEDLGDSLDDNESLIKKHESFEKSLAAQEGTIRALDDFATKLIQERHYAADHVSRRRHDLLKRRRQILERSASRAGKLHENYKKMTFSRDCDELECWIKEKLQTAKDESYLDPTNIHGKLQRHKNFERDVKANRDCLDIINSVGFQIIEDCHPEADDVRRRLRDVDELWNEL
ncbi:unnamed protein product, partial [Cylicostephanus goldi]